MFVEGTKTEEIYLLHWARELRQHVNLEISDIQVAFSNPCIELWFLLHKRDQWSALDRFEARRLSIHQFGFDKVPTASGLDRLVAGHPAAVGRAQLLDAKHAGDGSPPHSNPSSTLGQLIESMRAAGAGGR